MPCPSTRLAPRSTLTCPWSFSKYVALCHYCSRRPPHSLTLPSPSRGCAQVNLLTLMGNIGNFVVSANAQFVFAGVTRGQWALKSMERLVEVCDSLKREPDNKFLQHFRDACSSNPVCCPHGTGAAVNQQRLTLSWCALSRHRAYQRLQTFCRLPPPATLAPTARRSRKRPFRSCHKASTVTFPLTCRQPPPLRCSCVCV